MPPSESRCSGTANARKAEGAPLSPSELLDKLLFWGNGFNSPEPKTARFAHIYRWQGLTPIHRDRFVRRVRPHRGRCEVGSPRCAEVKRCTVERMVKTSWSIPRILPCAGSEFSDSIDRKIGQTRKYRTEVVWVPTYHSIKNETQL